MPSLGSLFISYLSRQRGCKGDPEAAAETPRKKIQEKFAPSSQDLEKVAKQELSGLYLPALESRQEGGWPNLALFCAIEQQQVHAPETEASLEPEKANAHPSPQYPRRGGLLAPLPRPHPAAEDKP